MTSIHLSVPLALGIGTHVAYFNRGEHHMSGLWLAILVPMVWTLLVIKKFQDGTILDTSMRDSFLILGSYAIGLYGSIVIYRLFFHPLRHFPGPILARVSKFWHVAKLSDLKNQILVEDLRHRYGDIVRIGPNELVVFRSDGFAAIHGPGSKCKKAPWYDMVQKDRSMHATRKAQLHQARRRIWDQGFGIKALQTYQERVNANVQLLKQNIARSAGTSINCTQLFLFFGFDVMGDTAFGEGFGMLESNKPHPVMQIMRSGIFIIGRLSPVPWLVTLLASLPGANADFDKLERFSHAQVLKRIQREGDQHDVMSKLIKGAQDPQDKEKIDMYWLTGDALVMIVAGSDTVSIALTFLFYELARSPHHVAKLREELMGVDISDHQALKHIPHLNALINETLRLYPPVPTGGLRQTPREGLRIGECYLPGDVTISTPLWSLGRLESSYTRANEFIPERWYARHDLIKDKSGFAPFLSGMLIISGKHSCLGKPLALMELRLTTACLITSYSFRFVEGSTGMEVLDVKDCFTALPGPLNLVFEPKEKILAS